MGIRINRGWSLSSRKHVITNEELVQKFKCLCGTDNSAQC